jgi:hypothetical protein
MDILQAQKEQENPSLQRRLHANFIWSLGIKEDPSLR